MAKKKSANLKKLHITDGKNRNVVSKREEEIAQIKILEDLLGMHKVNPYGTADKRIFADKVEGMTLEQMRELAMKVGVAMTNRQNELRKRLVANFDDYLRRHRQTVVGVTRHPIDLNSEAYKEIKDLLE